MPGSPHSLHGGVRTQKKDILRINGKNYPCPCPFKMFVKTLKTRFLLAVTVQGNEKRSKMNLC